MGELIGLLLNGWVSERIGYRWTVIGCLVLVIAWTSLFFTAQNVQTLLAAEILCGIVCAPGVRMPVMALTALTALGCLPDPLHHLCLGSVPGRHARIPYDLCQLLLGPWAGNRHWCHHVHAGP